MNNVDYVALFRPKRFFLAKYPDRIYVVQFIKLLV